MYPLAVKHSSISQILSAAALLLLSSMAVAMPDDKDQPIELTADSADINEAKNISIYSGNVDLRQGSMQILSDTLTVHHSDNGAEKVIAVGKPVHFKQQTTDGPVKAKANTIEYYVDADEVKLKGNAWVKQVKDTMESDRITWDRTKGRIKGGKAASGGAGSRVKFTIKPRNNDKK